MVSFEADTLRFGSRHFLLEVLSSPMMTELRHMLVPVHSATVLGHSHTSLQLAPWEVCGAHAVFWETCPRQLRCQRDGEEAGGGRGQAAWMPCRPQVFLVSVPSDLLGFFSGESPAWWRRAAQGPSCFSSPKASSSEAGHTLLRPKASLTPPPPGSLLYLPHPQ